MGAKNRWGFLVRSFLATDTTAVYLVQRSPPKRAKGPAQSPLPHRKKVKVTMSWMLSHTPPPHPPLQAVPLGEFFFLVQVPCLSLTVWS